MSRSRKLGAVGVAGLVCAACAAAIMTADKPAPETHDEAVRTSGAGVEADDHFNTPLGMAGAEDGAAPAMAETRAMAGDHADFIVKFEDAPAMVEAARAWRKDPDRARAMFRSWAKSRGGLAEFELVGGSYSGELILRHTFAEGAPRGRAAVNMILQTLRDRPDVAYCDPDFTAQPGKRDP